MRGWPIVALGLAGLIGGYTYTAPPFEYKFGSFGIPLVFLLMGPLMVVGAFYAITGTFQWSALAVSVPVGLLVAAILHGNEWRDISEDARAGARTFSVRAGREAAHWLYLSLVVGAYLALTLAVVAGLLPTWSLLAMLSLPLLVRQIRSAEFGASGQQRAIAMIDLQRDRDDRSADRAAPRRVRLPHGRRAPGRRACDAVKTRSSRSVSRRPSDCSRSRSADSARDSGSA